MPTKPALYEGYPLHPLPGSILWLRILSSVLIICCHHFFFMRLFPRYSVSFVRPVSCSLLFPVSAQALTKSRGSVDAPLGA